LIELRDYLDSAGRRPLRKWLDGLDAVTRARVARALVQLSLGNLSEVKSVGGGLLERL
jgi:putative component of toxin-antitoxin plasmid stabilization module